MSAESLRPYLDGSGRPSASLVTPIPPMRTGVATYAVRVLEYTRDAISWTVWYPPGGDPSSLPPDIQSFRLEPDTQVPAWPRIFMLGNSPECFEVAQALEGSGGTAVFHETVMHHMLRFGYLSAGRLDLYRRELLFEYGPCADSVEKLLSRRARSEIEYDRLLKKYPLTGRLLHSCSGAVCLNPAAASAISPRIPGSPVAVISHPLSPVPAPLPHVSRPACRYLVGMAGSGHPGRNADIFLKAVEQVRESAGDVRAVFVGGGWPDDIPEWAFCTGRLEEPEYQSWLRILDAAVDLRYPDCGETSGSLLELMRAGVCCVVSATGSFLHLPSDAVLRVPAPPSANACAAAIREILDNPGLREAMSPRASGWAAAQGSAERARAQWTALLAAVPSEAAERTVERFSLSAAWHEPPSGMVRRLGQGPVTWRFGQQARIDPPAPGLVAWVTAWGDGQISGRPLGRAPSVIPVEGGRLEMTGSGDITQVMWLPEGGLR